MKRRRYEFTTSSSCGQDIMINRKLESLTGAGRARFIRDAIYAAIQAEQRPPEPDRDSLADVREMLSQMQREIEKLRRARPIRPNSDAPGAPILHSPVQDDRHIAATNKLLKLDFGAMLSGKDA